MPVNQSTQAVMDAYDAAGIPRTHTLTPARARHFSQARRALYRGPIEPVGSIQDRPIPGPAGDIPLRIYTPDGSGPFPALVYFHGGGWVVGDLDSHDPACRALANAAGCVVVSVGYRLAPEHQFPAAADDAYVATRWVADNPAELGIDGTRIAVGGDSAGGNLAAVVALMARDRGGPPLAFQLLIYPVTDSACDTASYEANATGYLLEKADMQWFWRHYLGAADAGSDPYASPLRASDLAGLPPALVLTAEFDPLRDEGEAYAARLQEAGVRTKVIRYDGVIHGFFGMLGAVDESRQAIDASADALRGAFTATTANASVSVSASRP